MRRRTAWTILIAANVLFYCMLSFYQTTDAAGPRKNPPPFASSIDQRMEMVGELREIKNLLKEQNALLRSGKLQVVVGKP